MKKYLVLLIFMSLNAVFVKGACTGSSPTWTTTPDQSSVQTCINNASSGDTINVSSGNASWTSVTINKALTLNGAGVGATNITVNSNPSFSLTKQSSGVIRIKNITFLSSAGTGTLPHPITIDGPWPGGQAVIFQNDAFTLTNASLFDIGVAGGVIFSHNVFNGHWNDFLMTIKDLSHTNSWSTADSMGTRDTTGLMNIYVEDNTFTGGSNGIMDCDDNCRMVLRHNTFNDSGGFNSHGKDSSPYGMRHFEIYNNAFQFPDKSCNNGQTSISNVNQYIWIRGATGVIFNNSFDHLSSTCWGVKTEMKFNNRGAEDDRPQGSCSATHYPTPHQLGQNNNGSADFTDPVWFWGNTGTTVSISTGWGWGNPCGFDWNAFWQWGRDGHVSGLNLPIVLSSTGGNVSGLGGSSKPGYTPYTYPHPLVQGTSSSNSPAAPTNLAVTVQ